jgi:hypothetical protein
MNNYHIRTDADSGTVLARDLNVAIRVYFGATSLRSLKQHFARLDGGWCRIECDGETLVEIGSDR